MSYREHGDLGGGSMTLTDLSGGSPGDILPEPGTVVMPIGLSCGLMRRRQPARVRQAEARAVLKIQHLTSGPASSRVWGSSTTQNPLVLKVWSHPL